MEKAASNSYLSTGEVENFIGTTRRKLTECTNKGVVEPFAASERPNADRRWTLAQTYAVSHLSEFRSKGISFEQVAELTQESHAAFCGQLEELHLQTLRSTRRQARGLSRYRQEQDETAGVLGREGFYLRYIPQRWIATAPALMDNEMPGGSDHMRLLSQCICVAEVAGWAPTGLTGSVASFTADWVADSVSAYTEIAACPQPTPQAGADLDSGCYQVFSDTPLDVPCDHDCGSCLRFGREPTDYERFSWTARGRTSPDLHERVRTPDDIEAPYASGPWAAYTAAKCGADEAAETAGTGTPDPATADELCGVVPRLMPQELRLPYGVTAALIPAGVYLCCQHDERNQTHAFERVVGLAAALPQKEPDEDEERDAQRELVDVMEESLGASRSSAKNPQIRLSVGDPQAMGWNAPLEVKDFASTTLLAGLAPITAGGTCVLCEELPPLKTSDAPRFETQVLVSSPKLSPRGSIR